MAHQHQHQQSSRLHRLLTLLDTGSSQSTRFSAARQIGEIAKKSHPQEVPSLLKKVGSYLRSTNWDTRVAAARAVGSIAESVAVEASHVPPPHSISPPSFSFNITQVLQFGALVASGGQEYDASNEKNVLARQKQNLKRRLGLDMCEQFMDVNDMIRDEDLIMHTSSSYSNAYFQNNNNNIRRYVASRPSPRERNLLKRKAKINSKATTDAVPPPQKAPPPSSADPLGSSSANKLHSVDEEESSEVDAHGWWPFHSFVEQLLLDIFDPVWEVRHGSVMALREILTHQGASAGVVMPDSSAPSPLEDGMKRDREIDLNLQFPAEESEPDPKRPKFEEASSPWMDSDLGIKIEDAGWDFPLESDLVINEYPSGPAVKLDPDSYSDAVLVKTDQLTESTKPFDCSTSMQNIPENGEPNNWFKSDRASWLKNCQFLQDCAIRFLCVLLLDRFGDYVSDQVVAPVRETCAQALGVVFKYMHPSLVHQTLNILLEMQCRPEWEIRHGSLLGIKYLVAVRQEMLQDLLGRVLPACKDGLEDPDDDVRAVAADALIPAAASIVRLHGKSLNSIVMLLWDILLDLDDLSPSTSSVMNLLAEIYSQEEMIPKTSTLKDEQGLDLNELECIDSTGELSNLQDNPFMLSTLAPRLWPFMRHSITSVRYSAIRTLERLLEAGYKRNVSEPSGTSFWPSFILSDTLRIVFQNLLLESNEDILQSSERVWRLLVQSSKEDLEIVASTYMSSWIELASTQYGSALDSSKMFWPVAIPRKSHFRAAAKMRAVGLENESYKNIGLGSVNGGVLPEKIGDASTNPVKIIVGADVEMSVTHTRVVTSAALGILASKLDGRSTQCVIDPLSNALTSLSGVQRQVASMILISWFKEMKNSSSENHRALSGFPDHLRHWLLDLLGCADPSFPTKDSLLPYLELSRTYSKMRSEASQVLHAIQSSSLNDNLLELTKFDSESLSVDDAINLASKVPFLSNKDSLGGRLLQDLEDLESAKQRLLSTSGYLKCVQSNLHVSVSALVAAAVVWMSELPARLNPIILPLMASIRREQEEKLQEKAAEALAELIAYCISRKPSPNDKLIKNVCSSTCTDPCETPQASVIGSMENIDDQDLLSFGNVAKQRSKVQIQAGVEDRSKVEGFISRRGSELALRHMCERFGASLFDKLPKLWDCLTEVLKPSISIESPTMIENQIREAIDSVRDPQLLINNIQVVRSISPMVDEALKPKLLTLLPSLFCCIRHSHIAVRLASSRCLTSMARSMKEHAMGAIIENAIQMLGDDKSSSARHGAGMLISLLVQGLSVELVSYAPLLVVPLLRCMSDCDLSVRQSVTHSFAALVPLLPLARGLPPPVGLSESFSRSAEDAQFLEQLLDNSNIDDYKLSADLKVTLRRYQQEGINWLAFLKRFKLHGILCDDMGLGKTLQASAIVACNIVECRNLNTNESLQPSLIICPSTLVGHWAFEIDKYIDVSIISTLQYVGSAQERVSLREHFDNHNVVITSYDVVRKDIDYLGKCLWNYCILDEGHIIKNAKSKITHAVKQLKAQNRLILSGTPIQNNVMDLWSLFDFLMPGFLGTERQFQATYGKPLLAARDPKCSSKDAEAGALAMEALHKQVMPFLLRRTKDEVLSDLPEKIVQDRYCDLSPVQLKLYEQFSSSHVRQEISGIVKLSNNDSEEMGDGSGNVSTNASSHVFQALQYLLKLCSHPLLVIGDTIPNSVTSLLSEKSSDLISELHKPCHSPKLIALQEILEECGIGVDASNSDASASVGQHRVLIFAQHKAFLDIIERDLFQTHMKNVTYLRLDGSVATEKRFEIVKAFNSDPTIDALLLTTHVGGLGLNLTSADTLVFMEHDWNPMRDHQAMDRAHRLGQKKVVNVHRLIMRGTLEEKVMSLQRFKVSVANAVINAENASMKTMNTDQLLDLFASAETSRKGNYESKRIDNDWNGVPGGKKNGLKAILGGLEDLWDQSQYTEEYDLTHFLSKLSG